MVQILVLYLLSVLGFATGAVIIRRSQRSRAATPVHPFEVFLVAAALIAIGLLRPTQHRVLSGLLCIGVMAAVGMLTGYIGKRAKRVAAAGTREFESTGASEETSTLWKRYLGFSRAVVDYEFRLLLVATYLVLVGPIALTARLASDPDPEQGDSTWLA